MAVADDDDGGRDIALSSVSSESSILLSKEVEDAIAVGPAVN